MKVWPDSSTSPQKALRGLASKTIRRPQSEAFYFHCIYEDHLSDNGYWVKGEPLVKIWAPQVV